ncbi:adenylate kinase [Paenibacillus sp. LMG 31457]|uniref:Adenylate kinase n=1 Tax=Paenibacillus planticolens TaxID=2654976 RepID=A0ABX1ZGE6_9BACL|nr:adenylate kinase [Paenibacillus planticolens]
MALTGRLRSGKDSVAAYLCEKYGYTRFAFGDELKRYYHELFGEMGTKPREGYQWFGQAMRQRDPDVWVRKCFASIDFRRSDNAALNSSLKRYSKRPNLSVPFHAVITDLRQPNEYERCRVEGYVIIRVKAPEDVRINRAIESADTFNLADLRHDTEAHVDTFAVDYEIDNDGTLAELYAQIDAIMTKVG